MKINEELQSSSVKVEAEREHIDLLNLTVLSKIEKVSMGT